MVTMVKMTKFMNDDVVDDRQRSHQALPMEMQIPIFSTRCPSVAHVSYLNFTGCHTNFGCKVGHSLCDPRLAFGFVEILESAWVAEQ